jgi:AraC family transcriptional regulator of adaptative response/methylated-DNA-[protein]-cysteine methyltransferase
MKTIAPAAPEGAAPPARRHGPADEALAARRAAMVAGACRRIESADTPPSLEDLAREAGMSPHHFHRVFKAVTGLTPGAYAAACRARRVREELAASRGTVTDAIYSAGFGSGSRFYEASAQRLGMRPSEYRAGGAGAVIRFAVGQCSLGAILVARSQRGICAILLGDDPDRLLRDLQDQFPRAELVGGDARFEQLVARVVAFVEQPSTGLDLPLDIRGTAFQERVWRALRDIPPGETASYTDIARRIGAPGAVRAVARACASNPLAVAIPCHRVVRRDGTLSGYRWGVERKRELLRREHPSPVGTGRPTGERDLALSPDAPTATGPA